MTVCHAIHLPLFSQITKMGDALFHIHCLLNRKIIFFVSNLPFLFTVFKIVCFYKFPSNLSILTSFTLSTKNFRRNGQFFRSRIRRRNTDITVMRIFSIRECRPCSGHYKTCLFRLCNDRLCAAFHCIKEIKYPP